MPVTLSRSLLREKTSPGLSWMRLRISSTGQQRVAGDVHAADLELGALHHHDADGDAGVLPVHVRSSDFSTRAWT